MPDNSFNEIQLVALTKRIWIKRKYIFRISALFLILGLAIAILTPKEYTSSSTFIPQTNESSKSGEALGGLASLAGIKLGGMSGSSEIPPALYPKIASSVTFQKALLNAAIHVEGIREQVTYKKYYDDLYSPGIFELIPKYTIGLPGLVMNSIKGSPKEVVIQDELGLLRVNQEEFSHFKRLESQLKIISNEKEGIVTINFIMPEPLMSAEMTKFAVELLEREIIQFKVQKAKEELKFTEERFLEKKKEFEEAQKKLANFRDRNQNLVSAVAINHLQKLEADYNFSFNLYTELAMQVEQSRILVAKDTPILSVIQPVTVPLQKSNVRGSIIIAIFIMIGFLFSISYILAIEFLMKVK